MKTNELNSLLSSIAENIETVNYDKLVMFTERLCKLDNSLFEELDYCLLQFISKYLSSRKDTEIIGQNLSERIRFLNKSFNIQKVEKKLDYINSKDNLDVETTSKEDINIKKEEFKIERLKVYAKIATVFITVAIGTLGVSIINSKIQQSKIALQEAKDNAEIQRTEMTYLGALLRHALTDDNKKRLLFSEYYAELTVSKALRDNWKNYHNKIKQDVETYNKLKSKYDIAREKGLIKEVEKLSVEIKDLQKGLKPVLDKDVSLIKPRRIIHLSDLKIGQNNDDRKSKIVCIIDNLIEEARPSSEYLIIITGDLVDNPNESKFLFVKEQIDRLKSNGYIVLLVPGNHDYGKMGNIVDVKFKDMFKQIFWNKEEIQFPKVDIIDNIAFIGLDTMEGRTESPFEFATGILGEGQLKRLDNMLNNEEILSANYRVVYMHHSPFMKQPFMELKDANSLKVILQKHSNIDAMLFGNSLQFSHYFDIWHIKRSYDAGSSTADNINIRIIDITKEPEYDSIVDLGCKNKTTNK